MASFQENIIIISDMVKYQIGFLTVIHFFAKYYFTFHFISVAFTS